MGNTGSSMDQLEVERENGEVYEDWTMVPGLLSGAPVTVFSAAHPQSSRKRPYVERALQASRVYRHPGLLKYLDGGVVNGEVVVVTEQVKPLLHHDISQLSPLHISAGLQSLIDTLVFLHDRAGVSHNNMTAASVFITSNGAWKLWGLEYSCSFGELTRDHIEHINGFCHEKCIPPDDKTRISPAYQHARDSYAFACLVEQILSPSIIREITGAEDFLSWLQRSCKSSDWTQRPHLTKLADHQIFHHDFLKLHHNLVNVLLLTEENREDFIKSLADNLRKYPEDLVANTLSGALLSRPVLLHPASATHLMPKLLVPKSSTSTEKSGLFSPQVFQVDIVPHLIRLFGIHDATVRNILLTYLPHYVSLIPKEDLTDEVLPELLLGIRDSSDSLVVSTLHALAHLVPILGASTVIGKNRQSLFTTAKPKAASLETIKMADPLRDGFAEGTKYSTVSKTPAVNSYTSSDSIKAMQALSPLQDVRSSPAPAPVTEQLKSVSSLDDDVSLENLPPNYIPERSSPDGGEDFSSSANKHLGTSSAAVTDTDDWSDWEEMQENPQQGILCSPVQQVSEEARDIHSGLVSKSEFGSLKGTDEKTHSNDGKSTYEDESSYYKDAQPSSSMMLKNSISRIDQNYQHTPKQPQNLGEEFDILALKVKKKHDVEIDLFADIVPKFITKKYDLETMLMEADCKVQGFSKAKSPSVSETLAAMEVCSTEVGDAWGQEEDWDSQPETANKRDSNTDASEFTAIQSETLQDNDRHDNWSDGWGSDF